MGSVHICLRKLDFYFPSPYEVIRFLAIKPRTVISLLCCECWVIESQQAQLGYMLGNKKLLIFHKASYCNTFRGHTYTL